MSLSAFLFRRPPTNPSTSHTTTYSRGTIIPPHLSDTQPRPSRCPHASLRRSFHATSSLYSTPSPLSNSSYTYASSSSSSSSSGSHTASDDNDPDAPLTKEVFLREVRPHFNSEEDYKMKIEEFEAMPEADQERTLFEWSQFRKNPRNMKPTADDQTLYPQDVLKALDDPEFVSALREKGVEEDVLEKWRNKFTVLNEGARYANTDKPADPLEDTQDSSEDTDKSTETDLEMDLVDALAKDPSSGGAPGGVNVKGWGGSSLPSLFFPPPFSVSPCSPSSSIPLAQLHRNGLRKDEDGG
eukprot:TRINITY_DN1092_c1_g1_i2.p1 TRINITY_DN1092_c1_g1~~TRINITY_DN1092_c1_g1_i2.p1  ORF type:complete len:326 (-),score=83.48 TRINITY_DN1092_c1_g1_i2:678-1571(-)